MQATMKGRGRFGKLLLESNGIKEEMMDESIQTKGDAGMILPIHNVACRNPYFRKEVWTAEHAQITVMSIPAGGEIGLEMHGEDDQILSIEYGMASVYMGKTKQGVRFVGQSIPGTIILIPAGTWHNVINDQKTPLKLFSVYAPPHHPKGTVHKTKFESDLADY